MDDDRGPGDGGDVNKSAPDPHADDVWVAGVQLGSDALAEVDGLRQSVAALGAVQADQLRRVARLADRCAADARAALADSPRVPGAPSEDELVQTVVTHELMVVLGIGKHNAERLQDLAQRLVRVLPEALTALQTGRLDLPRVMVLVEETRLLDPVTARAVQTAVLATPGDAEAPAGPWEGPSPRAWRALVQRTVVKVDADAARRRREAALRDQLVRAWAVGDGTGVLQIVGDQLDVALADRVITDLALALPSVAADGTALTMDQRRAAAAMEIFRRIAEGEDLPTIARRVEREVGVVLHADTLFGDGPARDEPGELRGLGPPVPVDARSAAEVATAELEAGAPTRVLLTDATGVLQRTFRLPQAPPEGWTRKALVDAARDVLPDLPPLTTDGYEPTVPIAEHVRTMHPRCTSYDCARTGARCDLDHDEPWPRGPTAAWNLAPRCRRHHEVKTRGLVRTTLHRDGSVTTRTLLGLRVTTWPATLPGHGVGEAYAATV